MSEFLINKKSKISISFNKSEGFKNVSKEASPSAVHRLPSFHTSHHSIFTGHIFFNNNIFKSAFF